MSPVYLGKTREGISERGPVSPGTEIVDKSLPQPRLYFIDGAENEEKEAERAPDS
jgi:hypothetical protein